MLKNHVFNFNGKCILTLTFIKPDVADSIEE